MFTSTDTHYIKFAITSELRTVTM